MEVALALTLDLVPAAEPGADAIAGGGGGASEGAFAIPPTRAWHAAINAVCAVRSTYVDAPRIYWS